MNAEQYSLLKKASILNKAFNAVKYSMFDVNLNRLRYSLIFLLLLCLTARSQDQQTIISMLNEKISSSEKGEKLMWLDSLSKYITYDTAFEDDSVLRLTRELAIELDSFNIAIFHTSNIIYYQNFILGNPEGGKDIYISSQQYIKNVSKINIKCKYYYDAGNSFYFLKDFDQALAMYDSVEVLSNNAQHDEYLGLAKMGKGQVYTDMGDFGNASLRLQEAGAIFQKASDTTNWISARNSLVILYSKNSFYEEARKERDEIIELSNQMRNYGNLPVLYYNAASDQRKLKNHEARIAYLKKAIQTLDESEFRDYYEPIMLTGIVLAYADADSLERAREYLDLIHSDRDKYTTGPFRTYYLEAIKTVELLKKNYPKAIEYGEEYLSLMKEGRQYEEIEFGEYFLYEAYNATGNKEKALEHFENYSEIRDSIHNAQNTRVLAYYQTIYETEKRDLKIQAQESNIELLKTKDRIKNQFLAFGGAGFLGLFGLLWLARSRNFARKKQRLQEDFTREILETQEQERARIASELHDSIGQKLLLIKNALHTAPQMQNSEAELLGEAIREVREMSHSLHPFQFEKLGLVNSLRNMVETFQKHSTVFYSEDIEMQDGLIEKEKEIFIFRIIQEALTNCEKHANATACNLSSEETDSHVILKIRDNGKGFEYDSTVHSEGLGMKTIKERAQYIRADLLIDSARGKGTALTIKIPKK